MGSAGGVGGGGIYVPMLTLVLGFDSKSAAAVSKCMIMGAAGSTVYYNIKQRHPTLDMPLIDYDLALLFQPMLLLGISIGVAFNILFADWMITFLFIILFLVTSTKAILRGIATWKKETLIKKEANKLLENKLEQSIQLSLQISLTDRDAAAVETTQLLQNGSAASASDSKGLSDGNAVSQQYEVSLSSNVQWAELCLLAVVWIAFFVLQITKTCVRKCSMEYWILNFLQVPIALSATLYQAIGLYKGKKTIAPKGKDVTNWRVSQLFLYCCCGIAAGTIVGTLGLGGGFILTPLFLEIGIPPQVASATSTFSMAFSSSMSVVQYYLLKRFPVPYAAYLALVAIAAALTGQHVVSKLITLMGRASIIIFILAATILLSAFCLGCLLILVKDNGQVLALSCPL
uniref:Sulfite exporter TauE/SafE family protein n=1 Tax=Chenopodium quinoa TaxID=63459 RepID=A0A803LBW0_CHEQI